MSVLVFDIETIPDVENGRRLLELTDTNDEDTAKILYKHFNNEFLPHYLHRIVAISTVLYHNNHIRVHSLCEESGDEKNIVQRFFAGIDKYMPTLVSWNGSGFDLPVLHYRALIHGVEAKCYWENGNREKDFKWNNYLSRYHYRHLDLMDVLAAYQNKANARLDTIAQLLNLPGKLGMDGSKVWDYYQANNRAAIRDYCETDVLNTYLIFLRFELMRGNLTQDNYYLRCEQLKNYLINESKNKIHFQEFLAKWEIPFIET